MITADATPGVNDQHVGRVLFANAQTLLGPRRVTESRLLQAGRRLSGTYSAGRSQQAMINLGMPETVADDSAKALSLFAEGDADYITDDVPSILGGRPAVSNSSPPTIPQYSPEAQARVTATGLSLTVRPVVPSPARMWR